MTALVLGIVTLVSIVLSFAFASFALVVLSRENRRRTGNAQSGQDSSEDHGSATDTMSRVLADIRRFATLRQADGLTDGEFARCSRDASWNTGTCQSTPAATA